MRRFGIPVVALATIPLASAPGSVSHAALRPQVQAASAGWRIRGPGYGPAYASRPGSNRRHEFYFTRAMYSSGGFGGFGRSWAVDFPKGDQQFVAVLKRAGIRRTMRLSLRRSLPPGEEDMVPASASACGANP